MQRREYANKSTWKPPAIIRNDPAWLPRLSFLKWISDEDAGVRRSAQSCCSALASRMRSRCSNTRARERSKKISTNMTQITTLSIDEIATSIQLFQRRGQDACVGGAADEYLRQVLVEALKTRPPICWTRFCRQ